MYVKLVYLELLFEGIRQLANCTQVCYHLRHAQLRGCSNVRIQQLPEQMTR
jgi:hypothetical protein